MARQQVKPLSKTECKILVFNKVKRGMNYDDAVREVKEQIAILNDNHKKENKEEKNETL